MICVVARWFSLIDVVSKLLSLCRVTCMVSDDQQMKEEEQVASSASASTGPPPTESPQLFQTSFSDDHPGPTFNRHPSGKGKGKGKDGKGKGAKRAGKQQPEDQTQDDLSPLRHNATAFQPNQPVEPNNLQEQQMHQALEHGHLTPHQQQQLHRKLVVS